MDKYSLGWPRVWDHRSFDGKNSDCLVRIAARYKTSYHALTTSGDSLNCYLSGKLLHAAYADNELPAVGDWCFIGETFIDQSNEKAAQILEILPRQSKLSRMGAGTDADEQVLAANVNLVFVVTSATRDLNVNRLKRFILLATHGNATPVIVLSKIDLLSSDSEHSCSSVTEELENEFPDVEIIAVSALDNIGIEDIKNKLASGITAVFVGSSGVGKSTLVNALIGAEVQKTKAIRTDVQKGRHTTSASQLFFVESGGMIIDTPGLREVGLIADEADLEVLVPSVNSLSVHCRFRDCTHGGEPGCAVQEALEEGELLQDDLDDYARLRREVAYNRRKLDARYAQEERKRWKKITVQNRARSRQRPS